MIFFIALITNKSHVDDWSQIKSKKKKIHRTKHGHWLFLQYKFFNTTSFLYIAFKIDAEVKHIMKFIKSDDTRHSESREVRQRKTKTLVYTDFVIHFKRIMFRYYLKKKTDRLHPIYHIQKKSMEIFFGSKFDCIISSPFMIGIKILKVFDFQWTQQKLKKKKIHENFMIKL